MAERLSSRKMPEVDENAPYLGPRLGLVRIASGVGQVELASKMSYSQTALSLLENRKREPSRHIVFEYETALGVKPGTSAYNYVSLNGEGLEGPDYSHGVYPEESEKPIPRDEDTSLQTAVDSIFDAAKLSKSQRVLAEEILLTCAPVIASAIRRAAEK